MLKLLNHPMNYLDVLIENKIHVLMLWGTEDETVLYKSNGKLLKESYVDLPELLTVMKGRMKDIIHMGLDRGLI